MTVKKLREFLKQFPDNAEVWIMESTGYYATQNPEIEIDYQEKENTVYFGV